MRHLISGGLIAAALGTALLAAGAFPASAQVARPQSALAAGDNDHGELLTLARGTSGVRTGGGGGGGGSRSFAMRSDSGGTLTMRNRTVRMAQDTRPLRFNDDMRRHRRHDGGDHFCDHHRCHRNFIGFFGFGSYASDYPYYDDTYYYADNDAVAYCMSRFQSYDPASRTYLGYDGRRHPCP